MTKTTQKMDMKELVIQIDKHLQALCYSEESIRHYRYVWNNLRRYADKCGIQTYTPQLGRKFALERYGIAIGEPAPHTNAQRTVIRAIEVLNEYQNHGIVFRRKKSKDENYPVRFAKLFLDFYDYNLKRGLAPGTLRQFSIYTRKFARYLDHRGIAYYSEVTAADIQGFILTLAPYWNLLHG